MAYDNQNIFAKILRGEIPCQMAYEDEFALAFHDIKPIAPVHILVIPKGAYQTHDDFAMRATDAEIAGFNRAIAKVVEVQGLNKSGYRLIANAGFDAHQEVAHYHVHVLAGRALGPMLAHQ